MLFVHRWLSVGAEHQAQAIDGKHGVSDRMNVTRDCNALMASAAQMEFAEIELAGACFAQRYNKLAATTIAFFQLASMRLWLGVNESAPLTN